MIYRPGLVVLMGHPYGNYVVQRLFECSDKNTRRKIYEGVMKEENLEEIKKTNYGKSLNSFTKDNISLYFSLIKVNVNFFR